MLSRGDESGGSLRTGFTDAIADGVFLGDVGVHERSGYQATLMVYGPGGYRFTDYLRVKGPLQ